MHIDVHYYVIMYFTASSLRFSQKRFLYTNDNVAINEACVSAPSLRHYLVEIHVYLWSEFHFPKQNCFYLRSSFRKLTVQFHSSPKHAQQLISVQKEHFSGIHLDPLDRMATKMRPAGLHGYINGSTETAPVRQNCYPQTNFRYPILTKQSVLRVYFHNSTLPRIHVHAACCCHTQPSTLLIHQPLFPNQSVGTALNTRHNFLSLLLPSLAILERFCFYLCTLLS